jgi:hypothetical protein
MKRLILKLFLWIEFRKIKKVENPFGNCDFLNLIFIGGVFCFLFIFITYIDNMNNEQKAEMYNQLMFEYTRTQNQISSIKGESINLNESQLKMVRDLENKLRFLMDKVVRL